MDKLVKAPGNTQVAKRSQPDGLRVLQQSRYRSLALAAAAEAELDALQKTAKVAIARDTLPGEVETSILEAQAEQAVRRLRAEQVLDRVAEEREELEYRRALRTVAMREGLSRADLDDLLAGAKNQTRSFSGSTNAAENGFSFGQERNGDARNHRR